ncbi:MAG: 50S ribosomal protein L10 [Firmicutes bacterium]|nr:50S ribosomal protein L10 [Bacillota bacterium]
MSVEAKLAKQVIIDEIKERIENSVSVVVVDYLGITVEEADAIRTSLRNENVLFTVYKNSLVKRAIAGTPYEALGEALKGSSALAFCTDDATASARILSKAIKQYKKMAFKGGIVEGVVYDKAQIEEFAEIPSREELIARFMGSIQSPMTKLALTLKAIAEGGEAAEA